MGELISGLCSFLNAEPRGRLLFLSTLEWINAEEPRTSSSEGLYRGLETALALGGLCVVCEDQIFLIPH